MDPTQLWVLPTGKCFARCNHARRDVHRIDTVDRLHYLPCNHAWTAPCIQHRTGFRVSVEETEQDLEGFRRVWRAVLIGRHDTRISENARILGSKLLGFGTHAPAPPTKVFTQSGAMLDVTRRTSSERMCVALLSAVMWPCRRAVISCALAIL